MNENNTTTLVTLDQAVTDIIESIASQETALSGILTSEGERINTATKDTTLTNSDLLTVNQSVINTVNAITRLEVLLQGKLDIVKCQVCTKNTTP